jgi:hypothetical protein
LLPHGHLLCCDESKISTWPVFLCVADAEDFPFCLQPVVERTVVTIATLGMKLIGPLSDADL